jgi:hypothetical protein
MAGLDRVSSATFDPRDTSTPGHEFLQAAHIEGDGVALVGAQQHQSFGGDLDHAIGELVGGRDAVTHRQQPLFGQLA